MNQQRINSILGESVGKFNGRDFFLADSREAILSAYRKREKVRLNIVIDRREEGRFAPKSRKQKTDDGEERSTSFGHFAGIRSASSSIRRESIVLRKNRLQREFENYNPPSGSLSHEGLNRRVSSTQAIVPPTAVAPTGRGRIEINNSFSGEINPPDSGQVEEVSEYLANETIAQLRAAGLRA